MRSALKAGEDGLIFNIWSVEPALLAIGSYGELALTEDGKISTNHDEIAGVNDKLITIRDDILSRGRFLESEDFDRVILSLVSPAYKSGQFASRKVGETQV